MKIQILRVIVLLVSISAASVLVWNATRDKKPNEAPKESVISSEEMQGSSKLGVIVTADIIKDLTPEDDNIVKDKVPNQDTLIFSSKSGPVVNKIWLDMISDLTEKSISNSGSQAPLMHSSKAFIGPILEPKELENIIEGKKQDSDTEQKLPPLEKK